MFGELLCAFLSFVVNVQAGMRLKNRNGGEVVVERARLWWIKSRKVPEFGWFWIYKGSRGVELKFLHGRFEMWVLALFLGKLWRVCCERFGRISRFCPEGSTHVLEISFKGPKQGLRQWLAAWEPPRSSGYHLRLDSNTRLLAWLCWQIKQSIYRFNSKIHPKNAKKRL